MTNKPMTDHECQCCYHREQRARAQAMREWGERFLASEAARETFEDSAEACYQQHRDAIQRIAAIDPPLVVGGQGRCDDVVASEARSAGALLFVVLLNFALLGVAALAIWALFF